MAERADNSAQFYKDALFLFWAATVVTVILTAVAAMKGDLRWLLWLALLFAIFPIWHIAKHIGRRQYSLEIFFYLFVPFSYGMYGLHQWLEPVGVTGPIAVSPSEAKLTHLFDPMHRLRGRIVFDVYSRGDDPYYQIWIKIIINSEFLSAGTVDLDFPTLEARIKNGEEFRQAITGSQCLAGGHEYSRQFLCVIDRLGPKQSFQINLTSNYNTAHMTDKQIGTVTMSVRKFSQEPGERFENFPDQVKGAGFASPVPEKFIFKSFIVFCGDMHWHSPPGLRCTPNSRYH